MFGEEEPQEQKNALRRYGVPAAVTVFVLGGAYGIVMLMQHGSAPARPHREPPHITSINLPPPPPPPPPPKEQPKPQEQQKIAQAKPKPQAPKAPSPPAQVTTSIMGTGPGTLANGNGGGGDCIGADCGSGDGGDDNTAYYDTMVVGQVRAALSEDDRLRSARYHGRVVLKLDKSGRIINVSFENFDGDSEIRDLVVRDLSRVAFDSTIPAASSGQPLIVDLHAHAPG